MTGIEASGRTAVALWRGAGAHGADVRGLRVVLGNERFPVSASTFFDAIGGPSGGKERSANAILDRRVAEVFPELAVAQDRLLGAGRAFTDAIDAANLERYPTVPSTAEPAAGHRLLSTSGKGAPLVNVPIGAEPALDRAATSLHSAMFAYLEKLGPHG